MTRPARHHHGAGGRGLFAQMSVRENLVLGAYTLGNANARWNGACGVFRCFRA
jgi:ABC-type branched-subunit amino acid transport system ATPase component